MLGGAVALPLLSSPLPLQGAPSAPSFMPASQSRNAEMHPWDQDNDDGDVMDWLPTATPVRPKQASRSPLPGREAMGVTTGLEASFERTKIIDRRSQVCLRGTGEGEG